jgi:hypothetical protein
VLVGQFYSPKSYFHYILAGFLVLVVLVIAFTHYRKNKKKYQLYLDEKELNLLNTLLASPQGLTTIEVNDVLGLSNKSIDNQRKLRLNIISSINHQIYLKYRVENAIVRISASEDKRLSLYTLKEVLLPIFRQEFS